ncbi:MAG: hypothetical protein WCV90_01675 [Candidatus Woesearchaeota archaeon]|jgi:hypothetical protein
MKEVILDKKMAEFVGIMLGDGYISYPKCPRIKIAFNSIVDREYLVYVHGLLKELFNSKVIVEHRKNENCSNLYLFEREVIRTIINVVGLIPSPKWERARIPNWVFQNKLDTFVLRGCFDTDGCVVITNNNGIRYPRLEMKVSPSPMQGQFIKILDKIKFNYGAHPIGKGKVRIQLNGKIQLKKWEQIIGFSNPKHQRKCDSFLKQW